MNHWNVSVNIFLTLNFYLLIRRRISITYSLFNQLLSAYLSIFYTYLYCLKSLNTDRWYRSIVNVTRNESGKLWMLNKRKSILFSTNKYFSQLKGNWKVKNQILHNDTGVTTNGQTSKLRSSKDLSEVSWKKRMKTISFSWVNSTTKCSI